MFLGECHASMLGQTVHTLVISLGPYPAKGASCQKPCFTQSEKTAKR